MCDATPAHDAAIDALITTAFATAPHSDGNEAAIVTALRAAGALTLSLVACDAGDIIGQVAISPVTIDGQHRAWFGLGPVSVLPERQAEGIGDRLVRDALDRLIAMGAAGCVLLGDPGYYRRFGFAADPDLYLADVPPAYFQRLSWSNPGAKGEVRFHPAFGAA